LGLQWGGFWVSRRRVNEGAKRNTDSANWHRHPSHAVATDSIRVQFPCQTSGTLSEDIAPPSQFSIRNAVFGEGSAMEPAGDVPVSVVL